MMPARVLAARWFSPCLLLWLLASACADTVGVPPVRPFEEAAGCTSHATCAADEICNDEGRCEVPSGPVLVTESLPDASLAQPYTAALEARGGTPPYRFALAGGALPLGLVLGEDGALSGTPTRAGSAAFAVAVTDSGGASSARGFELRVLPGGGAAALRITTADLPRALVGTAYTRTLLGEGGQTPYQWAVSAGALPSGLSLSADGVLSGTPDSAGSAAFTVQLADSASPQQVATRAYTLEVEAVAGQVTPLLTVTTTVLPAATAGTAYSALLDAEGGTPPYGWTLEPGSALPPGTSLSIAGELSGTPTTAGEFSFTVRAMDTSTPTQVATRALTLQVASAPNQVAITTSSLPTATQGSAYSQQLAASGGTAPYAWSVAAGDLPPGVTLSAAGLLQGTPGTPGTFSFTAKVEDASSPAQSAQRSFELTVAPAAGAGQLQVTTLVLAPAKTGAPYQATLAASGGTPPYTWSVTSGSLPNGLTLSAAGVLSGTPTQLGLRMFTVQVQDTSAPQKTATRQLTLLVRP